MSNSPGIVSLQPDGRWDGGDGRWSTFEIQVGTPRQAVRLLPGTSATAATSIWTIISQGCTVLNANLTDCASKRGGLFASNASSTYNQQRLSNGGLYSIALFEETKLGLTDNNAIYGFDTVQLPAAGSNVTLSGQTVAGIATNNFFLGSLGLSPYATNITNFNEPIPSLLGSLRNQSIVNSTSWSYTAGKPYLDPPLYGSLTFGGYDAGRSSQSSLQLPFYQDVSRDLVVGLQSISYNSYGSSPLLNQGIYTFLNSLVPDIWLPQSACDSFQQAFNLSYSDSLDLYYVTDAAHRALLSQNPTFTFTLGSSPSGGDTTQITFPYAAFDVNKTVPDISSTVGTNRYFPLRRAANSTQYTLGRVFFQEAYVSADYDRQTFTVRQALNSNATQLRSLAPTVVAATTSQAQSSGGLSGGAIAGIVIGVVAALAILAALAWLLVRRRRRSRQVFEAKPVEADSEEKVELPGTGLPGHTVDAKYAELEPKDTALHELRTEDAELHAHSTMELPADERKAELAATEKPAEMNGKPAERWELPG